MAKTDEEVRAARQQMREVLIKEGISLAVRLRELRASGFNPSVAISKAGGLALIHIPENRETGVKAHLRFGPVYSKNIASSIHNDEIKRWNAAAPSHEVERQPLQYALERECGRVFLLMHEMEVLSERSPA